MVRVLVPRSDFEKHEKLSRYLVKFVSIYAVLDCDSECIEYLNSHSISFVEDRPSFKMHRIAIPTSKSVSKEISLDQLFYLAGLDSFVENYNYPAFHLLDRPVCIVDSGVDEVHEVFSQSNVSIEKLAISKFTDGNDDIGHGTAVASIISTLCPYSRIVSIKIFGVQSSTASISDFLEALDIALGKNCAVLNMSLGAMISDREATLLEPSLFRLAEAEFTIVASAGNEGMFGSVSYPARSKYALGVGAIDSSYMRAWYSNVDPDRKKPEVAFFGDRINCATLNNRYNIWSGTSFSAPAVSGLLYWIYYFYFHSLQNNIPVGYVVPSDPKKRWIHDGRRVLIELAKRNNPAFGGWNFEYGYGIPSYRRLRKAVFPSLFIKSSTYRRPRPAKLSTSIPIPIYINIPDLNKIVPIPTIASEQYIYNYNYYYLTEKYDQYITQYITNQYMTESSKTAGGYGGGYIVYELKSLIDFNAVAPSTILEFPPLELRGYGTYGFSSFNLRTVRNVEIKIIPRYKEGNVVIKVVGIQSDVGVEEVIAEFSDLSVNEPYAVTMLVSPFDKIRIAVSGSGRVSGVVKVSVVP